ncbi:MAG: carbohydrate kinase [Bacteroidales bacterium]|nr:carbohydrate kinase [Bacteroidales bacterium]
MNEDKRFVVGIGEVLWDKFYKEGKLQGKALGGAPANFAYHAAQFGHESLVVSAVGLDKDGNDIISELESHSLPYHLDRVSFPTGTVDADITNPNAPVYTIRTRCAWSHIPFNEELREIAASTKAVCFGSLAQWGRESRQTIRLFLDSCPEGCLKVCDVNLRQTYFTKSTLRESLRRADILKLNEDELSAVTGLFGFKMAGEEVLCRRLMRAYDIKMVILTKGMDGSWVVWKEGRSFQGTPRVKTRSAVGAGDSFTGAFIGSLLNGKGIAEAHETAVKVAAFVCTQKGAMPAYPENLGGK